VQDSLKQSDRNGCSGLAIAPLSSSLVVVPVAPARTAPDDSVVARAEQREFLPTLLATEPAKHEYVQLAFPAYEVQPCWRSPWHSC
jgi:hypothetical protein